jgi:hypothetical protein
MANDQKGAGDKTIAPLRNVALFSELVERVVKRSPGLPGMACFHGPSGRGKTSAATYAANTHRAYHVRVQSAWTRRAFVNAIAAQMGTEVKPIIADTVALIIEGIAKDVEKRPRPLIIDEADYLVKDRFLEIVRDIHDLSGAAVILIGEEDLPRKLQRMEKIHGRMLDWVEAQRASIGDARHLARLYCPGLEIADDLLEAIHHASDGSARRIVVNLDRAREAAALGNMRKLDRARFTGEFFTGAPPAKRAA